MNYSNSIDLAVKTAMQSPFKHRIGAVILDNKDNILAVGCNSRKTHPVQYKHAQRAGNDKRQFLHAEIAALVKIRSGLPETILVVRVGNDGSLKMARPCPVCMSALAEAQIRYMVYSKDDGTFGTELVAEAK